MIPASTKEHAKSAAMPSRNFQKSWQTARKEALFECLWEPGERRRFKEIWLSGRALCAASTAGIARGRASHRSARKRLTRFWSHLLKSGTGKLCVIPKLFFQILKSS